VDGCESSPGPGKAKLTTDKHGLNGLTGIAKIADIAKSVDWKSKTGNLPRICTDKRGSGKSHRLRPGATRAFVREQFLVAVSERTMNYVRQWVAKDMAYAGELVRA
jgi:hypothetical protein